MKVLLTGITGNLGLAVARELSARGVGIVVAVRDGDYRPPPGVELSGTIRADITDARFTVSSDIDSIVHCAGVVHFTRAGSANADMMRTVVRSADTAGIPVHYASTAFLWRPPGDVSGPRNAYERDKAEAEEVLRHSGLTYTIFRPSVLVGDSAAGALVNWTGYYQLVGRFRAAAEAAGHESIRFPALQGAANMVPVDQAASAIVRTVMGGARDELIYVTNPDPPRAQWVLEETLRFFGLGERFDFTPVLAEVELSSRSEAERSLAATAAHFAPYWALSYEFPESACVANLVDAEYLRRTLAAFTRTW